jgi:hypothetical protein
MPGMVVYYIVMVLVLYPLGYFMTRSGLLLWRGQPRPRSRYLHSRLETKAYSAGSDRALLVTGVGLLCFASMVLFVAIAEHVNNFGSSVWLWLAVFFVLATVVTMGFRVLIVCFNRPRFLVPPHMREQSGTFPTWWRTRRENRRYSR